MAADLLARFRSGLRAVRPGEDFAAARRVVRWFLGLAPRLRYRSEPGGADIDGLLATPDDRLDFALAACRIAASEDPSVDEASAYDEVSVLGIRLKRRIAGIRDPGDRVLAANAFIFSDEGFGVDVGDRRRAAEGLLLPRVLERRRGHCVGLSSLYVALSERAGLPLHAVRLPRHIFVRYDDGFCRINIEPTRRGASYPDEYYVRRYDLSPDRVARGLYLGNLTKREFLIEILHNVGNYRYALGQVNAAIERVDRATQAHDAHAAAHLAKGFFHHRQGDYQRAIHEYRRAIEVDPELVPAHVNLGDAYLTLGRTEDALAALRHAVALAPDEPLAYSNLGRLHTRRGEHEEAIRMHERALDIDPLSAPLLSNLGVALHAAGRVRDASRAFERATERDPRFIPARENLARLHVACGHRLRAYLAGRAVVRAYRDRLREAPGDGALHLGLGRFLAEVLGRPLEARAHVVAALALRPDYPPYLDALIEVHRREKNYPAALALVSRFLALDPASLPRDRAHYERLRQEIEASRAVVEA